MNDTPQKPPAPAASNYRCREHNECSVTWKGTGCPRCAGNLKRLRQPRQAMTKWRHTDDHCR